MSETPTVPIAASTRWNRACLKCGEPITLGKHADTHTLLAFQADPQVDRRELRAAGMVEHWKTADRHFCGRLGPRADAVA